MKTKLLIALAFFASCTATNRLNNSGKYVVEQIINKQPGATTLKLKGIARPLIFFSDTLKVNDTVFVNVLDVRSKKIKVKYAK